MIGRRKEEEKVTNLAVARAAATTQRLCAETIGVTKKETKRLISTNLWRVRVRSSGQLRLLHPLQTIDHAHRVKEAFSILLS
jgi:hypothetical protein